jgi:NDP-sugar pyrophosphorylase family protein
MVIMAGGQGTRLRPKTDNLPKPLLHIDGKPILEHIIEKAKLDGFSHFVLAVYYLKEMIQEYFKDGSSLGVEVKYLEETKPLGTAGALSIFDSPPEDDFIVTNGDVITEINYAELLDYHKLHNSIATMAVRRHEFHNPFGVVETSGIEITGYEEKPVLTSNINAGVYALSPVALDFLSKMEHCDMPELFEKLRVKSLNTVAYPIHEQWMDIGRLVDLDKANSNANSNQKNKVNEKN